MEDMSIRCKNCRLLFQPDIAECGWGKWPCPDCGTYHPNLRRHYRSIGLLFLLGMLWGLRFLLRTIVVAPEALSRNPVRFLIVSGLAWLHTALLVIAVIGIYSAIAPWKSAKLRALIWVVFCLAFVSKIASFVQLYMAGFELGLLASALGATVVIYLLIFVYLLWLHFATKRVLE